MVGAARSTVNCDILVHSTLLRNDGLPRSSKWIIAGLRNRRLVEAVLGIQMLVIEDRVARLGPLVLLRWQLREVLRLGSMARVMMVITLGVCHRMMSARLIVLELIGVILT